MARHYAIKRVYAEPGPGDGCRVLVDRLWPRGVSKAAAGIELWLKDVAPSDALRRRVHAAPDEWDAFVSDYAVELQTPAALAAAAQLRERLKQGPVTLLYAAKNEARNNATALRDWLEAL